ncbi:MAG: D-alanyl-D-alanine carboxypeptidase/D-alanyl-D-alanine-endopeptidase [Solirubrobacterales bacterium]|nr:D-alanyl-D-alanine carboxypeptidase/D-alanyl-D-alanine-endopeptidase [Solirubrobacterales bacterium]
MRRRLPVVLCALAVLLLLGAAPASAVDRAGLRSALAKLHARLGPSAGAYVVDLDSGAVLYRRREDLALAPASNEKLFTTAAALLRFGPDATLETTLQGGGEVDEGGVLRGDLFLVGGGDPTLGDPGLRALARALADAGVTRVDGGIVGDESLFDQRRGTPASGFAPDYDLYGWLSALSWRHGRAGSNGPAQAAAARLGALLKAEGVRYGRRPRAGRLPASTAQAAVQLAAVESPPMRTLVAETNVPSENFYAEMLVKALGARYGTGGSTAGGLAVVRSELAAFGVHPRLVDGSGLSRANRTTARQVVRLLERMDGQEIAAAWRGSLPVAGRTGTIRKRMRRTAAAGRCAAKTGTLIGISALSGYCTTTGGRRVAFSLLENRVCAACAKKVEDRMVAAIAKLDG